MIFQPPREETEKRDRKTMCLFPGGQFKYPGGVVLGISGVMGHRLSSYLRCDGVWREMGEGIWGGVSCTTSQIGIWMRGSEAELSTKMVLPVLSFLYLRLCVDSFCLSVFSNIWEKTWLVISLDGGTRRQERP